MLKIVLGKFEQVVMWFHHPSITRLCFKRFKNCLFLSSQQLLSTYSALQLLHLPHLPLKLHNFFPSNDGILLLLLLFCCFVVVYTLLFCCCLHFVVLLLFTPCCFVVVYTLLFCCGLNLVVLLLFTLCCFVVVYTLLFCCFDSVD